MSAPHSWRIENLPDNNRDLRVVWLKPDGVRRVLRILAPGESIRPKRSPVLVEAIPRPPRFEMTPEGLVPDSMSRKAGLKARLVNPPRDC